MPKHPSQSTSPRKSGVGSPSKTRKDPEERAAEKRRKEEANRTKAEDKRRRAAERKRIQEQKEQEKLEKEERKQKWAEYVVEKRWLVDEEFQHGDGVQTITKGRAMELFRPKLKPEEMETLPHDRLPTAHHPPDSEMHLFSIADVVDLARRRAYVLGEKLVWAREVQESRLDMSELIIAHSYTPMDDDPPPSQIIWMSEHLWGFGIGMADACLAYCLEPKDLKGLKAKCGWLDLQSVAVKALKVHGGLKGHNEIVLARRKADVDTIQELFRQKSSYDSGRPIKPYSKSLRDFLKARLLRPAPSRSEEILQRTVLQYAPIFIEQQGRRWRWRHGRYSLGSRDLPPGCCLDIQA